MKFYIIVFFIPLFFLVSCGTVSEFARGKYKEAVQTWEAGEKEAAIDLLNVALKDSPKYFDARIKLGNYYYASEKFQESLAEYTEATKIDPFNPAGWILSGETCITIAKMQDGKESQETYRVGQ